ncbi:MAG: hypothetical protein FGM32_06880 [Candidatus Kapabacteria bacterium]|nr:hypothetical protein [Candidatus Kapabacteria bacterium]
MTRPMLTSTVLAAMLIIGCAKKEEVQETPAAQPAPVEAAAPAPVDSSAIKDSIAKAEAEAKEAAEAAKKTTAKKPAKTGEKPAAEPAKVEKQAAPTQQIRQSR